MRHITREELLSLLKEETGFIKQDLRVVLKGLDSVIAEQLTNATLDEGVSIQLLTGVKLQNYIVPERNRVNPRDRSDITCPPTVKLGCKFSQDYKRTMQEKYESKQNNEDE